MWNGNHGRSMFQYLVICVKARAGGDGYFVTIASFLDLLPVSEELSCISVLCHVFVHT